MGECVSVCVWLCVPWVFKVEREKERERVGGREREEMQGVAVEREGEVWRDRVGDGRERGTEGGAGGCWGGETYCRVLLESGGFHGDEGRWEGERREASPYTRSLYFTHKHTCTHAYAHTHTRTRTHTHRLIRN